MEPDREPPTPLCRSGQQRRPPGPPMLGQTLRVMPLGPRRWPECLVKKKSSQAHQPHRQQRLLRLLHESGHRFLLGFAPAYFTPCDFYFRTLTRTCRALGAPGASEVLPQSPTKGLLLLGCRTIFHVSNLKMYVGVMLVCFWFVLAA